jgi:hypothetical protein
MAFRGCPSVTRTPGKRRTSRPLRALVAGALAVLAGGPSVARADVSKAECIQANSASQDARRAQKFSTAHELLTRCIDPSCPAMVRDDCTRRLDDLERAQPTIVFDVRDASGHDVVALKVTVDGKPLAEKLVGSPLAVDPGEHTFTFTVPGGAPVTQTFVIKEGVKDRDEIIVLGGSAPVAPQPTPEPPAASTPPVAPPPRTAVEATAETPSTPSPEKPAASGMPWRTVGWVLGGVGLAGIGVGTVLGLEALSTKSSHCEPNGMCTPPGTASNAYQQATISTVGLIAGGALLVGGLGLVLFAPGGERSSTTGVAIGPLAGPSTAGAYLSGRW